MSAVSPPAAKPPPRKREDESGWLEPPLKRRRPDSLPIPDEPPDRSTFPKAPPTPPEPTYQQLWDAFAELEKSEAADTPEAADDSGAADNTPSPAPRDMDDDMPIPAIPDALPESVLTNTFERHVRAMVSAARAPFDVEPLRARLEYLTSVMEALERANLIARGSAEAARKATGTEGRAVDPRPLMLFFESATRPQSQCQLWSLLRTGLTTASRLRWGHDGPHIPPQWLTAADRPTLDAPSVMFGRVNEATARTILFRYLVSRDDVPASPRRFIFSQDLCDEDVHSCGVLIDAHTGMLGASLDILVSPRDESGRLAPRPGRPLMFYEVKCRAKYAFDPGAGGPLAAAYDALLAKRSPEAFREFIRAARNPCVWYFPADGVPCTGEALVTSDPVWACRPTAPEKRRATKMERSLLALNRTARSRVLLFGAPNVADRTVCPVSWSCGGLVHTERLFANPRHSNFKQILVQAYVLNSHFPERAVVPHLVTFIGRRRTQAEEGISFALGAPTPEADGRPHPAPASILPEQAIPVALILTPIHIDASEFRALQRCGRLTFDNAIAQIWASLSRAGDRAASETL
ncbi:deoxyribonuclease [Leporid alphaherpesvirus 4]|uniref:Deoxyribonuclease n=1 Tax=Leporid alphaherpesvirus 4 TaxID=481315 RepID=J9QYM1_9ALPH|nr:deoxyribonuclease [Leporid alphaherpesvirus 4]AFR32453.1 deoxyribonuclease [Leporid alphaherpesvirus 4]